MSDDPRPRMRSFELTLVNSVVFVSGAYVGQMETVAWAFALSVGIILLHALLLVYRGYTEAAHA